jgi:hypothetical protein
MRNVKGFVVLVITGTTGLVIKGLKNSGMNIRKTFNRFSIKKKEQLC